MLSLGPKTLKAFWRDVAGLGAIEFALVVPVLLTFYVGGVDVTRAVTFHQKLQQATTAINDLAAQETDTKKVAVAEMFTVADAMLAGFDMADFKVKVTSVKIDTAGKATVVWSVGRGFTAQKSGQLYTVPEMMASLRDTTVIVTETAHAYDPLMKYVVSQKIAMSAISVARSRGRKDVSCSDCT